MSPLSSVPKSVESIHDDRFASYPECNRLLARAQHGFLKCRLCATNQLDATDHSTKATDDSLAVDALPLDFTKAFSSVDHASVYAKLIAFGDRDKALRRLIDDVESQHCCVRAISAFFHKRATAVHP
ncbi:hypothetical protein EG68_06588 [Paragonimus skrjabini miyazakii]|uniref:Uncharacterized protein n=1 Tax=Paragonimus skrjabini miyazakii TaxID=59628 RepID=A0A8S9YX38_9TREM|nr:hypothetical protein EG68_06588 [Paragonimus skrjabini miyazakii]